MRSLIILPLLALAGCSTSQWRTSTKLEETVWQAANIEDIDSTSRAMHHHCAREMNPILPPQPNDKQLVLFGVAASVLHYYATDYVERSVPDFMPYWQGFSIIVKGTAVLNNNNLCP